MSKHTPGPWHVNDDGDVETEFVDDKIIVNTGETGREHDARLIAAAPDLLAACREVLKCDEYSSDPYVSKAINLAVAAVNKAMRDE